MKVKPYRTCDICRDMLSTYDWSECKESLQIGWERREP